jgi:hypothetical protein
MLRRRQCVTLGDRHAVDQLASVRGADRIASGVLRVVLVDLEAGALGEHGVVGDLGVEGEEVAELEAPLGGLLLRRFGFVGGPEDLAERGVGRLRGGGLLGDGDGLEGSGVGLEVHGLHGQVGAWIEAKWFHRGRRRGRGGRRGPARDVQGVARWRFGWVLLPRRACCSPGPWFLWMARFSHHAAGSHGRRRGTGGATTRWRVAANFLRNAGYGALWGRGAPAAEPPRGPGRRAKLRRPGRLWRPGRYGGGGAWTAGAEATAVGGDRLRSGGGGPRWGSPSRGRGAPGR